jgi:hypothetical protein
LDAAEVRANRTTGFDALDLECGALAQSLCGLDSGSDRGELSVQTGEPARRPDYLENGPSTWSHAIPRILMYGTKHKYDGLKLSACPGFQLI